MLRLEKRPFLLKQFLLKLDSAVTLFLCLEKQYLFKKKIIIVNLVTCLLFNLLYLFMLGHMKLD